MSITENASPVFGGPTALHFLRDKARLQIGEHLLINGATGSVVASSIQIAKCLGAKVTAVCSSSRFEFVKSVGADHVVDYHSEEFTLCAENYDVIMDNVGNASWARSKRVLNQNGRLVLVSTDLPGTIGRLLTPVRAGRKIIVGVAEGTSASVGELVQLANLTAILSAIAPIADISFASALSRNRTLKIAIRTFVSLNRNILANADIEQKPRRMWEI
ncbi:zinc-binding dehydrogenase [Parasphingorhabdus marina]|uniref:zinc-binding dehydrogenase n=1 Tax=Parasphingorhabdus marina TaxID=394732 RepID=UPI001356635D|nr:zinc-binding dehydrogenase [Parasphingorhabdus marina]